MWYSGGNVPAIRKVASAACSRLVREIGLQVTSPPRSPPARFHGYTDPVNVPAARTVASRLSSVKWRYNVWPCASPKIGSQVAFSLCCFLASRVIILPNVPVARMVAKRPAALFDKRKLILLLSLYHLRVGRTATISQNEDWD